ncbi:MAG: hypothetical protein AAFV80_09845 [Bacteroidota bacterium]
MIWFPPFGILALTHSIAALRSGNGPSALASKRSSVLARRWVSRALIGGLCLFVVFAWIVFLFAGQRIAPLATFY